VNGASASSRTTAASVSAPSSCTSFPA
jgi:hypothetical protein